MQPDTVSIVGGGWSVKGIALAKIPGTIIAVNESAVLLPRVDVVLSMDRLWSENRWPEILEIAKPTWLRDSAAKNIPDRPRWLRTFIGDIHADSMSQEIGRLHGDNSGRCALNLAYQLNPARVLLFGFDMQKGPKGEPYWYAPYSWARAEGGTSPRRYQEWAPKFAKAAKQFRDAAIEVVNVSDRTALTAFPVLTPAQMRLAA